eukprot:CAMPEP_0176444120 /NCGR_PEP_ID=MMETSP0127-20121128/22869_1 /TAXON_ID=938130 /ORGANISM="Platyophrya macrostoma, Strain WH" /LENGTH=37 /DNA_ID= /DNA_START= /DNA_END= /DNA_ORIENTATION=
MSVQVIDTSSTFEDLNDSSLSGNFEHLTLSDGAITKN